jgi:hypothetical protein
VIAERKDCNLRSWSLADGEMQSRQHRGLSSGVASGKSAGSRYAYSWVETSTPLNSGVKLVVISDKCFASESGNICILITMLISCETVNVFHYKKVCMLF